MKDGATKVITPWGEVAIKGGISFDDGNWQYETERHPLPTRCGNAVAVLSVSGNDEDSPDPFVWVTLFAGEEVDRARVGEPSRFGVHLVGWSATFDVDPSTGHMQSAPVVQMQSAVGPGGERNAGGAPRGFFDDAVRAEIAGCVEELVRGWRRYDLCWAVPFFAAGMRALASDLGPSLVVARRRWERIDRQVRAAEALAGAAEHGAGLRTVAGPGPG